MNYQLNETQLDYQREMKKFAKKFLNYGDKTTFSRKIWEEFCDYGWLGLNMPQEYGGLSENNLTCTVVLETLGYACDDNGFTFVVNNHWWMAQNLINVFASVALKKKYLKDLMNGKKIGAFALTESEAGSDSNAIQTRAELGEDMYVLNGSKIFVSNAPIADIFVVFAVTQVSPIKKISAFVVESSFEGLFFAPEIKKMGLDSSPTGEIFFRNCKVPKENLLGEYNEGEQIMLFAIETERFYEFVPQVGAMQRIVEKCIHYTQERKQFGKSISQYQSVSHKIANMYMKIELARAMMYRIADLRDKKKNTYLESSIFKLFTSESYVKTCRDCLQIYGAYGYTKDYPIERELRDALSATIYAGSSEIQRNTIFHIISSQV